MSFSIRSFAKAKLKKLEIKPSNFVKQLMPFSIRSFAKAECRVDKEINIKFL